MLTLSLFILLVIGLIIYGANRAENAWKNLDNGKIHLTQKLCRNWTDEVWNDIQKNNPKLYKRLQFTQIIYLDQRIPFVPQTPLPLIKNFMLFGLNMKVIAIFPHAIETIEDYHVGKMKERFQSIIWHEIGHLIYGYDEDEIKTAAKKGILKITR